VEASPTIAPLGDCALLATFARVISWEAGERVRAAAARVRDLARTEITDVVPSYTTLGVYYDAASIDYAAVVALVAPLLETDDARDAKSDAALLEIPVRYDGPDLQEVAERTGLTVDEVIARHTAHSYRAYACGFQPGFAYLGDLDEALALPRRSSPRLRVPPGSVAIAGRQTAVYPLQTPGGWHLIGTTTLRMFDATREPPALIRPGDEVRFVREEA
jgi:KipI family sensor histidine kinase inhibitor